MSDNLLDPRHPRSPYNRFNWDGPYSQINPNSPSYDAGTAHANLMAWISFPFVILLIKGMLLFIPRDSDGTLSDAGIKIMFVVFPLTMMFIFYGGRRVFGRKR